MVWSLGALSAGFALGYTLGYAHKNTKGSKRKHSQLAAFADSLAGELSTVGQDYGYAHVESQDQRAIRIRFRRSDGGHWQCKRSLNLKRKKTKNLPKARARKSVKKKKEDKS